jgi:hypothetical protein
MDALGDLEGAVQALKLAIALAPTGVFRAVCADIPHFVFSGQTPDEIFFGTGAKVPEELALAKGHARAARMTANRAMSCERCLGQQASLPGEQIPH